MWERRSLSLNRKFFAAVFVLALLVLPAQCVLAALGNGKLQIHHIDVAQGDGILIISPQGQLAIVDDGTYTNCPLFVNYITGLGVTNFDYNFASHYHADHIGCLDDLTAAGVVLNIAGYDRGYSYSSQTYTDYVNALGSKRQTMTKNQTITLDAGSANPVYIKCVDLNGAGVYSPTGSDENSKSVVLKVTYGNFDEVMGGDLTGGSSNDVETTVGPEVGDVEVYKVHHHGSATSSIDNWLTAITAEVGVISVGTNSYGHPTSEALSRLHNHNVKTYWTETGSGASPVSGWDKVGGTIIVEADPGAGAAYTVKGSGFTDTYYNSGGGIATKTYYPTSTTMLIGTIASGSYLNLAADDASYMRVNSAKSGKKYYTDWYGSTGIAETPTKLTITYDGKYSTSRTQTLHLYNFSSSSWTQVDQASVGTSDVTRTYTMTSPSNFVSASGEIRARVTADARASSYSCSADYLAYTIEYATATIAALPSGKEKEHAYEAAAPQAPEALTSSRPPLLGEIRAWPNPFNPVISISFELERSIDGEVSMYDVSGRKILVLAKGRLDKGSNVLMWSGTDANGRRLSSGVYVARLDGEGVSSSTKVLLAR
ncbi:MAG: T9SS type A sorting domain-containing protein [Candidatus Eisenbacteria bacterium]|nr:T9SS type A sorting domain-containing protein [Candidatus Eisenbacteria bacterium]